MSRVLFLSAAYLDIRAAFEWYDAQRPGLGDEFISAVDSALETVAELPHAHPSVHRDTRRFLVPRFPYCLFYRVSDAEVVVIACLHAARDPEGRRAQLDEREGGPDA